MQKRMYQLNVQNDMKNHISLVLFLCISAVLSANAQGLTQNQYANAALASMFEEIELDRVPTGYLLVPVCW